MHGPADGFWCPRTSRCSVCMSPARSLVQAQHLGRSARECFKSRQIDLPSVALLLCGSSQFSKGCFPCAAFVGLANLAGDPVTNFANLRKVDTSVDPKAF